MLQFLSPIANLAGTWLKGRQKKAEIKQKLEVAKIEAQVKRVQSDANWEEKQWMLLQIAGKTSSGQFVSSPS